MRKIRKSKCLTLCSLCYKNALEPSTVSRIEKGLVEPKLLTVAKLIEALEIEPNDLFNKDLI